MEVIGWYKEAKNILNRVIEDEQTANAVLNYEIYSFVWSSLGVEDEGLEVYEFFRELLQDLYESLDAEADFDISLWKEFFYASQAYWDFQKIYRFPGGWKLRDAGTFWTKLADQLCDKTVDERVEIMRALTKFYNWIDSYCTVYSYQYSLGSPWKSQFVTARLTELQYDEYKELEAYIEKIKELDVEAKIEKLTRVYLYDEFDYIYPDRETLFLDFLRRGISVPEALKMVKLISCGKTNELTEHMNGLLVSAGYTEETIQRIKAIHFLKSKRNAIVKLLFEIELV
jgi:hypothetical protein